MMDCRRIEKYFIDALYNTLPNNKQKIFEAHLEVCSDCSAKFRAQQRTLEHMDEYHREAAAAQFYSELWHRIAPRLQDRPRRDFLSWVRRQLPELSWQPAWNYGLAAALIMLVVGILIGKYFLATPPPPAATKPGSASFVRAERYFARSKVLLLGIMNHDPADHTGLSRQRELSRNLIREAAVLKDELKDPEQLVLNHLIAELEVILMQIANLEEKYDLEAVQLIQNGIERKGVLFKINLNQVVSDQASKDQQKTDNKIGI